MNWTFSPFGQRFQQPSGILELMDDLGRAMASADDTMCMLGGGNPAPIPEVEAVFRQEWSALAQHPAKLDAILGKYDTPRGSPAFLEAMSEFLRATCGWDICERNLFVCNGSQNAFFYLFNFFAGDGKKILLPLSPEYIGYADQGIQPDIFRAQHGRLEMTGAHSFKYHIDFDNLRVDDDVGAIAVSRPTNPTGNVITDAEIERLSELAREHSIPLMIDNAYGDPFPGILFRKTRVRWESHMILSLSLSKLGLPGTRTGIVVADEPVIRLLTSAHAILGLASGNVGQALVTPLLRDGRLNALCRDHIRPFYQARSQQAAAAWELALGDTVPWMRHEAEGSMFHWLRFPGLPGGSRGLYERLKQRGVLVIPGDAFFYGLDEPAPEQHECIRVHTAMNAERLQQGIVLIADTLKTLYR